MSPWLVHFYLLASVAPGAWASPFHDSRTPHARRAFVAKIRRSSAQPSNVSEAISIFDPNFAIREVQSVFAKYAQAAQFLAGIGLNPDTHPEKGYVPYTQPVKSSINSTDSGSDTDGDGDGDDNDRPDVGDAAPAVSRRIDPQSTDGILSGVPGVAQMPLVDYIAGGLDLSYFGPLQFGAGKQALTVDIDTGSADLWVPVNCRSCNNKDQFHTAQSPTFTPLGSKFSVVYGTGRVSGQLAQDTVALGGLSVPKQIFGAVNRESDDFNAEPSSGLLGLAFGSIARSKSPTFFENLLATKQVAAGVFAVHLARGKATGSEACFGCADTTKAVGPISWCPVISKTYWSIQMDGISPDALQSVPANLTAAIDTGTTLIYVPQDIAEQFYELIPGSQTATEWGEGFYTFPCAAALSVSLSFSGRMYSVDSGDFNLGRTATGSPNCVGGILALGSGFPPNLAIVGDEFLKSWYSIYDYAGARVGFAASINQRPVAAA